MTGRRQAPKLPPRGSSRERAYDNAAPMPDLPGFSDFDRLVDTAMRDLRALQRAKAKPRSDR